MLKPFQIDKDIFTLAVKEFGFTSKDQGANAYEELLSTEANYVEDLYTFTPEYRANLVSDYAKTKPKAQDLANFRDLLEMYANLAKGNEELLGILHFPNLMAWTKKITDLIDNYMQYLARHDQLINVPALIKNIIIQDPRNQNNNLNAFLAKPMQRILKYPLLLKEIHKAYKKVHPVNPFQGTLAMDELQRALKMLDKKLATIQQKNTQWHITLFKSDPTYADALVTVLLNYPGYEDKDLYSALDASEFTEAQMLKLIAKIPSSDQDISKNNKLINYFTNTIALNKFEQALKSDLSKKDLPKNREQFLSKIVSKLHDQKSEQQLDLTKAICDVYQLEHGQLFLLKGALGDLLPLFEVANKKKNLLLPFTKEEVFLALDKLDESFSAKKKEEVGLAQKENTKPVLFSKNIGNLSVKKGVAVNHKKDAPQSTDLKEKAKVNL